MKVRLDAHSLLAAPFVKRAVVKVKSRLQKEYLFQWIKGLWAEDEVEQVEKEKREGKIVWEIAEG